MDSSRLKTIILLILLVVNICFGALFLFAQLESSALEANTERELESYLNQNGMRVSGKFWASLSPGAIYLFSRDRVAEQRLAESALGAVLKQEQGGNVIRYYNHNGEAVFRGAGHFSMSIRNYILDDGGIIELSLKLLDDLGIQAVPDNSEPEHIDGNRRSSYICTFNGVEIYGCSLSVTFKADGEVEIAGRRISGEPLLAPADSPLLTPLTAIIRFIHEAKNAGIICAVIENMQPGFEMSASAAEGKLSPIWKIITDSGIYYINAIDGNLISPLS